MHRLISGLLSQRENPSGVRANVLYSLFISFSACGTYSLVWVGSNQGTYADADSWRWIGSDYTSFYTGNQEDEEIVDIISITDTQVTLSNDGITFTLVAQ